jgi:hypothetical protein
MPNGSDIILQNATLSSYQILIRTAFMGDKTNMVPPSESEPSL